jgi:hypothetical protein
MEMIESLGWIALGFVPTLGGMELVSRILSRRKVKRYIEKKPIVYRT